MNSEVIVFIHKGYSSCLFASITTARESNPCGEIILIGDETNNIPKILNALNCEHVNISKFESTAIKFAAIYRHDGNNSLGYELFCLQRWFILNDFLVTRPSKSKVLYLDSDAFLFEDASNVLSNMTSNIALCHFISPAFTYIKNVKELDKFCTFVYESFLNIELYEKLVEFVKDYSNQGMPHISDMTLFGEYSSTKGSRAVGDLRSKDNSLTFYCDNFSYPQGMQMGLVGKRIEKDRNGNRYFINEESGIRHLAGGVHFQGMMKTSWILHTNKATRRLILREEFTSGQFRLKAYLQYAFVILKLIFRYNLSRL
jgi:hypothetical protein